MEAEMRIPGHAPIRPELHYLKKDAVKIDAMTMLKQMKVAGKISVESEAQDEEWRILDYEIEFWKQNNISR